jgi:hypothetical protein
MVHGFIVDGHIIINFYYSGFTYNTGIAQRRYTTCFLLTAQMPTGMVIPYENVPQGLFPLEPELCGFNRPPW